MTAEEEALIRRQLSCRHGTEPNPAGFAFVKFGATTICLNCGVTPKRLEEIKLMSLAAK